MPIPKPNPKEKESEYVSRCMEAIGSEYDSNEQAVAVCYATYRKNEMQKMSGQEKINAMLAFNHDFRGINLFADSEDPCWSGYQMIGMKDDGTPNCVPIKED